MEDFIFYIEEEKISLFVACLQKKCGSDLLQDVFFLLVTWNCYGKNLRMELVTTWNFLRPGPFIKAEHFFSSCLVLGLELGLESSDQFEIHQNNGIFSYSKHFHMTSKQKPPVSVVLFCEPNTSPPFLKLLSSSVIWQE